MVVLVLMKKSEYPIPNVVSPDSQVEKNMAGQKSCMFHLKNTGRDNRYKSDRAQ